MFNFHFFRWAVIGSVSFTLMACTPAYDPNLTPEQNRQARRDAQFNRTMGEGALAGTALGALVGGLAGHGKGALIGSLSGAALGTGTGYLVAHRTENQQRQEDQFNQQIAAAHQIAMTAQADAEQAFQEADQLQTKLTTLNKQLAAKRITRTHYRQQLNYIRNQTAQLRKKIDFYDQKSQQMHQDARISHNIRFEQEARQTDDAVKRLKYAENMLVSGIGAQPAS